MLMALAVLGLAAAADDPAAAAQRRYPVHATRITTASGTFTYYSLPADAPPELRRAYQMLELAEREAVVVERVQLLKAEYVENERRLEAARTYREVFELQSFGPVYPSYRGYGRGRGWGYYYTTPSPLKVAMSGVIAESGVPERAIQAADRLAQARVELRRTLLDLAAREKAPPPAPPEISPR